LNIDIPTDIGSSNTIRIVILQFRWFWKL